MEPGKDAALRLLLEGKSVPETARELRVGRGTVWRWSREPGFAARYSAAVGGRLVDVVARLDCAAAQAVDVLVELATDTEQPAMVRVRAAGLIVSNAANASLARRATERQCETGGMDQLPDDELIRRAAQELAGDRRAWPALCAALLANTDARSALLLAIGETP
ncbi:MAG: helix-turn-helix domain-containing protein [Myxococcales bacterium]|nr:helix-turn-helix domain-containing protein [Myxococcales bacterium]